MEIDKSKLDDYGHLKYRSDWSEQIAEQLAATDAVQLTKSHWQVIKAVQTIYDETGDTPPMRILIKLLRQRLSDNIDSRFLYRLFPDGPIRLASKYAGLPKPKHCM